jgi:hypothetical protein
LLAHGREICDFARIFADLTADFSRGALPASVAVLPGFPAAASGASGRRSLRSKAKRRERFLSRV